MVLGVSTIARRRPNRKAAADSEWDAIVIGEYERAFYGASTARLRLRAQPAGRPGRASTGGVSTRRGHISARSALLLPARRRERAGQFQTYWGGLVDAL